MFAFLNDDIAAVSIFIFFLCILAALLCGVFYSISPDNVSNIFPFILGIAFSTFGISTSFGCTGFLEELDKDKEDKLYYYPMLIGMYILLITAGVIIGTGLIVFFFSFFVPFGYVTLIVFKPLLGFIIMSGLTAGMITLIPEVTNA